VDGGQSGEIAMKVADILAWQVDFLTEPRPGDEVRVVWERYRRNGEFLFDGRILAVEYRGKGNRCFAVYYDGNEKYAGYYDLQGQSVRKAFLKAPLSYRRISSYFSHSRFHPILRYWRPHLGIDYAAPTGTPVEAVGDGKVIFAGRNHDYGNQVQIRHNSTYVTYYGHLSRFARGIKKGVYVKQGQVIGYVGMTGLATGPHLDFRIKRNGKFVNFLKLKIPPAKSLPKRLMEEYKSLRIERLAALGGLWKYGESAVDAAGIVNTRSNKKNKSQPIYSSQGQ
jgi:murein DD-endopeptidase MepM/ murein hydrolase activator NlpD